MRLKGNQALWWIASVVFLVAVYNKFFEDKSLQASKEIPISEVVSLIEDGHVQRATVAMTFVVAELDDGTNAKSEILPFYTNNIIEKLQEKGVTTKVVVNSDGQLYRILTGLIGWVPMLIFIVIWVYFMRKSSSGAGPGKLFGFGKSKAKAVMPKDIKVRLKDVAGIDEAKMEVVEIVDFLKCPKRYVKLGAKIPKGCLLHGSPGTGKTMLAKSMAGESEVPFFHISGSDFVEMFVGVGASRVREMFTEAKKHAPCILFIDEIDAVGRHRGSGVGGGNDEREQTLNQILVEMDGFEENIGVVVIAATNRPDVLDDALLRPGRFDRQISIPKPDIRGRESIFRVHTEKIKLAPDVEIATLAKSTPGFSGAEIANMVNEAALIAGRAKKVIVAMGDFEKAKDKIILGIERSSIVMKDEERKLTAYHEAGHAIVAIHSPGSDPIHKATIIPRGRALGVVMRFPTEDSFSMSLEKMLADLAVSMGGRVAEELIFGAKNVTSGAMSDIRQATSLATSMVREWGMSDKVGRVNYPPMNDPYSRTQYSVSDATSEEIDSEIRKLIHEAEEKAKKILTDYATEHETLAQALLKYETLTGKEIDQIIVGQKIERDTDSSPEKGDDVSQDSEVSSKS